MNNIWYHPDFDLGEFRYTVARYVKYLVRARRKFDAEFLSITDLRRWGITNIEKDTCQAWQLLHFAATTLATLNTEFIPRCGSGGVPDTDQDTAVGRLIFSVVFLVDSTGGGPEHNQTLVEASEALQQGASIDWKTFADWEALSGIRDDLDLLPHPKQRPAAHGPSSEFTAKFPAQGDLGWEEVTIEFVSNDALRVSARGQAKTYMFSELGFKDQRKGDRPDTRWGILRQLAKESGRLGWDSECEGSPGKGSGRNKGHQTAIENTYEH